MKIYLFEDMQNADSGYLINLIDKMPEQRADQARKYIHLQDKVICVLSFLLLRYGLSESGIIIDKIEFAYKNNSKPYLTDKEVFFNISHTGDLIICGISDTECGVDIEKIKPYKQTMAEYICSPEEIKLLSESLDKEETFARIWTMKESYLKYKGIGIGADLKLVDKHIKEENLFIYISRYDNYIISSCLSSKAKIEFNKINFNMLVDL